MNGLDNESTSLRDSVESAYASHSVSPDIESIVNGAKEEHTREVRSRNEALPADKHQREAADVDSRRSKIREALNDAKTKAARGESSSPAERTSAVPTGTSAVDIPAGPPAAWDQRAKALWHQLPPEVRLASQRAEATYKTAIESHPHIKDYKVIDEALAPLRGVLQQNGIQTASQAVTRLLDWEGRFRNPQTRMQAFHDLAREYGVSLGQGGEQYQQQPQYTAEHVAVAERTISQFASRPNFAKVSATMGGLIMAEPARYSRPDGSVDVELAFQDACKVKGIGATSPQGRQRSASPSGPAGRAPAYSDMAKRSSGASVRDSLLEAARSVRNSARV